MAKIVLISCAKKKLFQRSKAKDLYVSTLFKYNLQYAKSLKPDKIFILSAKYGLLDLEQEIEPYDKTLNKMTSREVEEWSNGVISQLNNKVDLKKDEFIFLAGNNYRKYLVPQIPNNKIPLKGLSYGRQLKYLKENVNNERKL
jgi:hypothetical protein